jgi:hypothetical protein
MTSKQSTKYMPCLPFIHAERERLKQYIMGSGPERTGAD